jgi:hypothetical protein
VAVVGPTASVGDGEVVDESLAAAALGNDESVAGAQRDGVRVVNLTLEKLRVPFGDPAPRAPEDR